MYVPLPATGNHDGEADLQRREIAELDAASGLLSLTQPGPQDITGAANYYLDVYDSAGRTVAARIWMLDSMARGCGPVTVGWWVLVQVPCVCMG